MPVYLRDGKQSTNFEVLFGPWNNLWRKAGIESRFTALVEDALTTMQAKRSLRQVHILHTLLVRNKKKAIFHSKTGGYNPNQDVLHQLPRHQQTTIFRLRTGHCRQNSHLKGVWRKDLSSLPLWRSEPNTRTLPAILLTLPPSKAGDTAHLCVPQNQALGVCRKSEPDIQVYGTYGREDRVDATTISSVRRTRLQALQNSVHMQNCPLALNRLVGPVVRRPSRERQTWVRFPLTL